MPEFTSEQLSLNFEISTTLTTRTVESRIRFFTKIDISQIDLQQKADHQKRKTETRRSSKTHQPSLPKMAIREIEVTQI
jgi:hypothetical protein